MSKRLERSATNRVIAGVCGGIAEYLEIDATLVRIFFVFATIITAGAFFLAYIVGLVLMPLPDRPAPFVRSATAADDAPAGSAADATTPVTPRPHDPESEDRRRSAIGYLLIALGAVILLANVGAFHLVRGDLLWPLVLIGIGALLLAQRVRR